MSKGILIIGESKGQNRCMPTIEEIYKWGKKNNLKVFSSYREINKYLYKLLNKFGLISILEKILLLKFDSIFYLAMNTKHISTLSLANKLNKKIILDFYSHRLKIATEDRKVDAKPISLSKVNKLKNIDKKRITLATHLIVCNKNESKEIYKWCKLVKSISQKEYIIPLVIPQKTAEIFNLYKKTEGNNNKINIAWWGLASYLHGFDFIFSEFENIFSTNSRVRLNIFEISKSRLEKIINLASKNISPEHFERINFSSNLNMKNGLREWLIDNCHLSLGPLGFTTQGLATLSNKVIESWEMQIPVVTQKSLPISNLKIENLVIPINAPKKGYLSNAIQSFIQEFDYKSPKLLKMTNDAHHYYKLNHSPTSFSKKLNKVLDDIK